MTNNEDYCVCEFPLFPIGGYECERCGKTVKIEYEKIFPPALGVTVKEKIEAVEKVG